MSSGPQLAPLPHAIGVLPQFYARGPETIIMKEKVLSLSGDSFEVRTQSGQDVLSVQGAVFSLSGRKQVTDMQGNPLFSIRKEHFTIHSNYYLEDPQGRKFLTVEGKFSFGGTQSTVRFTNASTGRPAELVMDGNFFGSHCTIVDAETRQPVAQIDRRRFNARQLLGGQQTYAVHVAPGMDISIIAALCICLDERKNEN